MASHVTRTQKKHPGHSAPAPLDKASAVATKSDAVSMAAVQQPDVAVPQSDNEEYAPLSAAACHVPAAARESELDTVAAPRVPAWKRTGDLLGALLLLTVLSPFLLAVALYIKCSSTGPFLFRQRRFGRGGRSFRIWKFRTMHVSVDPDAHGQYVRNLMNSGQALNKLQAPQGLIRGGSLLRATGVDELPQLVNVVLGQMSLVGPRPDVIPPSEYQPAQRGRFHVLPGITGLWQVSGKNRTTFEQMIELDVEYARRRSPWLDLKILLMTGPAVLRQFIDKRNN